MQTRTVDLESLFLDGVFDIPEYQRGYAWDDSQLDDLLDDLRYLPSDRSHFFGNVVLEADDQPYRTASGRRLDVFRVVDGQQRLTTALILLDVLGEQDSAVSAALDEANLVKIQNERPRLLPRGQDGEFFRDAVLGDATLPPETPSQSRLEHAREYLEQRVTEMADDISPSLLAERLRYDIEINIVEVDDGSEAASIFESLNDRGKPLSSLDKTKSFLMYMHSRAAGSDSLRSRINQRFGGIYQDLFVLEDGHNRASDFSEDSIQQFHWGIYDGFDSDEYFASLDTLKQRLHESYRHGEYESAIETIDEYTQGLREASTAFAALFRPESKPPVVRQRLLRLLELGRVANVLPVLIAGYNRFSDDPEGFAEIVAACETLVFRMYAVDGRRSDTGQGKLVRLAHRIHTDRIQKVEDVVTSVKSIVRDYTDDDRFERLLRSPDFYESMSSRDIRYLFYHYGQALEAEDKEFVQRDLNQLLSSDFQVEHVLAQALDQAVRPESIRNEYEDYVHRLGNLTVASRYWNSTYGALPFSEKREVPDGNSTREKAYANSSLKVQKVLAEIESFGKNEIESREAEIIEFALEEWPVGPDPKSYPGTASVEQLLEMYADGDQQAQRFDDADIAVMRALLEKPGWALRSIHKAAASVDDSPIEWTDTWSSERTRVQNILYRLRDDGLAYTNDRSWHPVTEGDD